MEKYQFDYITERITGKQEWLVDVPVLILFFNRPDQLEKVFDSVCKAKPSTLLLYQDGAREQRNDDVKNVEACRRIVESVDWNCTVYRMYQNKNYGCDPSGYMSRKWAFSICERCIVLEDDVVPSVAFFSFCKELLDRYQDDKRIYRISGQNILGEYQPYDGDYFFTKGGSIWGWATWKRVFDEWDPTYAFLNDEKTVQCLIYTYQNSGNPIDRFINKCKWHRDSGKEYFESIYSSTRFLGTGLTIVPCKNLVSNIGISAESTHNATDIRLLTKQGQKAFNAVTYELEFPLKHPRYILEDKRYEDLQSKFMGWKKNLFQKATVKIEEEIRKILYSKK